jgi:hypothetical protein
MGDIFLLDLQAEGHRAQAKTRDAETGIAEFLILHDEPLLMGLSLPAERGGETGLKMFASENVAMLAKPASVFTREAGLEFTIACERQPFAERSIVFG